MSQLEKPIQVRIQLERSPDTKENLDNLAQAFLAATDAIKTCGCRVDLNPDESEFIITKCNN